MRSGARACAELAESLPAPDGWTGEAAQAYDAARHRAADRLSGGPGSLSERLEATASLADALRDWMLRARMGLALVLAEVLASAEAVELSTDPGADRAAAEVGARVLREVAESYERAADLLGRPIGGGSWS